MSIGVSYRVSVRQLGIMKGSLVYCLFWIMMNDRVFGRTTEDVAQVKLVTVLFRHGDRTPNRPAGEFYPNDPYLDYDFFPVGPGHLTNDGKKREFDLGEAIRSRYDEFLGSIYYPEVLEGRSTDYDRTKMSLQLVLNGIFPPAPSQQWKDGVDWQPFPTTYFRLEEDRILYPTLCPKYRVEFKRVWNSPAVRTRFSEFQNLGKFLEENAGMVFTSFYDFMMLYSTLAVENALGLELPQWTNKIFPDGELLDATRSGMDTMNYNNELKKLNGGMLLRKITDDFLQRRNGTLENGRKLYLYSAHDFNVASLLITLGIQKSHMPAFSSAVIVELLEYGDEYFVKMIYYPGIPPTFEEMQIPGCAKLCPLDEFLYLMKNVTATDDDLKCL